MTTGLSEAIRRRIKAAQPAALSPDRRALLLIATIGGSLYLTPDGKVLESDWERGDTLIEEKDVGIRNAALVFASRKYPELAALLPQRPASATDCAQCSGLGWLRLGGRDNVCGDCSGLGWRTV